jgi:uncharacterized Zn finger protein
MPGVPLFNARIEDLVHADAIEAECLACGHKSHVAVGKIKAKLPDWYRVLDLPRVLRCDSCGKIGRSIVTARQALGYDKINE